MDKAKGEEKTKNTKENAERKPSIRLKTGPPPPVRQTITSKKRMLNANPLLRYQEAGINIDEFFKSQENGLKVAQISTVNKAISTLESRPSLKYFKKPEIKPLARTQSLKMPKSNGLDASSKKLDIISGNKPLTNTFKRPLVRNVSDPKGSTADKPLTKPRAEVTSKYLVGNRVEQKKSVKEVKAKVNSFVKHSNPTIIRASSSTANAAAKPEVIGLPTNKTSSLRRSPRRSLSSSHIQSKKGKVFDPKQSYKTRRSQSHEDISVHAPLGFSPIMEESTGSKKLVFKTPSAYERRSIYHVTPRSARKSSLFQASTPAPVELQRLQERLNKWLKSRGKPLASFHHLRCFGIDEVKKPQSPEIDDENKENVEVIEERTESYEELKISITPEKERPIKNDISEEESARVAKEAMVELQKLIEEDYPRAQCLGWLELIREKYTKAVDEPEYWECRAAIEQSLGNVGNAVEFYKTAIIQGAEVTTVDKSLDQLLKKFSLLNISPSRSEQKVDGNKERIVREARSVFKSTIIQFAIQERKLKKNTIDESSTQKTKRLVATPVRRSTRMSRSCYVSTPGVKLCTSLKEINLSTNEINFEKNTALC